jgi:hypothetical protein
MTEMDKTNYKLIRNRGLTLAEAWVALVVGTTVLIAIVMVFGRIQSASSSVLSKLGEAQLSAEVLQRIAEDLDNVLAAGNDTSIIIHRPKYDNGYKSAKMEIVKTYFDKDNKLQNYEKIVWQSTTETNAEGLVLYRGHTGEVMEDKLLDQQKEKFERELYVPICDNISYLTFQPIANNIVVDQWDQNNLPNGVVVTISFAEPFKNTDNTLDVLEEEKIIRTIAIDRTRKLKFAFPQVSTSKNQTDEESGIEDSNSISTDNDKTAEDANSIK